MSDTEKLFIDEFLNNKKEYVELKTDDLIKGLIACELEKKEIDRQIKILKEEAKLDGVDVNKVSKVFNKIKTRLRAKEADLNEEDKLEEQIMNNYDIVSEIKVLIAPITIQ